MEKKVVILGAGYAGVLIAKKLERKLRKQRNGYTITLIDRNPFHTMLTELHEVAAGRVDESSIKMPLDKIFAGRSVNLVQDEIQRIDCAAKLVHCAGGAHPYDCLVVATGGQPAFFGVEGAAENSFKLWSYQDAVRLRDHIELMFRSAALTTDREQRRSMLTFCIAGAGLTGVEMAGELAEYIPALCEKHGIPRREVLLYCTDLLEHAVPMLPEKLSAKVERRLEKTGCSLMLKSLVTCVGTDYFTVKNTGGEVKIPCCTVIWSAGIECAAPSESAGLLEGAARGRIPTDEFLRAKSDENVFVAGDLMLYTPPEETAPVPQMVENCELCAGVVAHNILCTMDGGEMHSYTPSFHGIMCCVGGKYGVAHVGGKKRRYALPSFLAMLSKHFINLIYFIQVLGWSKIVSYMRHEFFHVPNGRSFVGGHFSNNTPGWLMFPLRMYLGFVWLWEGVQKLQEGWLRWPKLADFFGGANRFYAEALGETAASWYVAGAAGGVDAVASATASAGAAGATEAAKVVLDWNLWLVRFLLVDAGELAFRVRIPLVDAMIANMIIPSNGMQMFFQTVIVLAEILIGLALIAGLFNFPASAASLVLQILFVTSTGLYMGTWWMVFASLAVLLRGGRAFGLDYWVMPALGGRWRRNAFARKWYLYHD